MSLDYDLRGVRTDLPIDSSERKEWRDALDWNKFQSLVFNCIPLGISNLSDPVVFYDRYNMYYASHGWDTYYDFAFVKDMVGLRTNVNTYTDAVFNKQCVENLKEEAAKKRIAELKNSKPAI
jgi:hypothetical protein